MTDPVTIARFPVERLRQQFPALNQGDGFIFFDNAAGAQVPMRVIEAVRNHLVHRNVQRGGPYQRSLEVDAGIERARASVADLVNANHPDEIAFGMNSTSFMRSISLAVGQTLERRNEIVVSDLDHEANIATWLALERWGAKIVWWRVRDDARLHTEDLDGLLSPRTRLVTCAVASNAIGTKVDVAGASARVHTAGAEMFLDAVHYGPHGPIDVQAIGCDYLACSGYKIFSPHMGFIWSRREAINRLPTFREDFIPDTTPAKLEAGTFVYENVAGMDAVVGYLEDLGRDLGSTHSGESRRAIVVRAMEAIQAYEATLSLEMLRTFDSVPGARVYGVTDPARITDRVPTFCFTVDGIAPADVAARLSDEGIGARSGHMYSPRLLRRLRVPLETGLVRVSLVHYNTHDEIARFGDVLRHIAANRAA